MRIVLVYVYCWNYHYGIRDSYVELSTWIIAISVIAFLFLAPMQWKLLVYRNLCVTVIGTNLNENGSCCKLFFVKYSVIETPVSQIDVYK